MGNVRRYRCRCCGKMFQSEIPGALFCSKKCYRRDRYEKEEVKQECPYNPAVGCIEKNCEKCGWNPAVAEKRLQAVKKRLGVKA